ncbi:ribosomal RNA processing protein 36 homolog [Eucyclogobius newberryi]|uniref:ribosomal RNA processing protein 36 homolog n=1 Tax=Eucyclogobius newberryi TaxID=166745 RepID=UPI003B5B13E3
MKRKQKRPVSSDEDSDVERNFALFTERRRTEADEGAEGEGQEGEESGEEGSGQEESESNEDVEGSVQEGEETNEEEVESEQEGEESDEAEAESEQEGGESDEAEAESEQGVGGGEELRTRADVQKELSHMSFEDVLKLQNQVGTKVYNRVKHDGGAGSAPGAKRKRLNKNRPMEMSAKKPVAFLRQVVSVNKSTLRDPRFDHLSGEYKADIFEKTYGFINNIKHQEKEVIKKKLKKTKSEKKKEELQFLVKRMENQERATLSREQQRNRELEFKRQQRQRANQGQAPLFLNNSERKKLQLLEKYQDLKRSGKLENFLSKKRKRNATKDRKKLPPEPHSNAQRGFH